MTKLQKALQKYICVDCDVDERLNLIINTAPIGICTVDKKGNFITTNKAYEDMLGYTKEEMRKLSFYDVTHPDYRPCNKKMFLSMFTLKPSKFKMDKVYIRKDGTVIDVSVYAIAVESTQDNQLFGTAFITDTTEAHRMVDKLTVSEAKYRSIAKELYEAQRMFHFGSWTHSAPAEGWDNEPPPNTLSWSDETYRIFEIDKATYTGDLWDAFIGAIHPEDVASVTAAYIKALDSGEPYTITHRLVMPDGRIKLVIECCENFYDDMGNAIKSVGTVQDITKFTGDTK